MTVDLVNMRVRRLVLDAAYEARVKRSRYDFVDYEHELDEVGPRSERESSETGDGLTPDGSGAADSQGLRAPESGPEDEL